MRLLSQNLNSLTETQRYLLGFGFVHTLISLSLYYFSQYFYMAFLQIIFLVSIFPYKKVFVKKLILFSYFMCLNYALILIFSFTAYILYFINLSVVIFFIYDHKVTFTKQELLACGAFAFFVTWVLRYFKEEIFDIYIYFDIVDGQNYFTLDSAVLLSIMHLFILFFIVFKKDRKYLRYNKEK